jgi:hypothetical protein
MKNPAAEIIQPADEVEKAIKNAEPLLKTYLSELKKENLRLQREIAKMKVTYSSGISIFAVFIRHIAAHRRRNAAWFQRLLLSKNC